MSSQQRAACKMTVLSNTITVSVSHLDALYKALEEAAASALAPQYPYEETDDLLDHLRLVWEWTARIVGDRLCCLLPDRDFVDIQAMEKMWSIFAPYVEDRSDVPSHFAYRDDHTGETFRYLLIPGRADQSARVIAESGKLYWHISGTLAPCREQASVLADMQAWIGQKARLFATEPGKLLALCIEQANECERDYREANRRADNEDADLVDTQYMEDELVYPLKRAAKLRNLALELLIEHQVWPGWISCLT